MKIENAHNMGGGFWIGLHHPHHAYCFPKACISINRLTSRTSSFGSDCWLMDSGAFTEITKYGCYRTTPDVYVRHINSWAKTKTLKAAVSQDYMCESFVLAKTGLTIEEHQKLTLERYDSIMTLNPFIYILPVLQGYAPEDYLKHLKGYGNRLKEGSWVGVGSVCKRNAKPDSVVKVLQAIHSERPDLKLHGFGLKITALECPDVVRLLWSSDSMAWSYNARRAGLDANSIENAKIYWYQVQESIKRARSG